MRLPPLNVFIADLVNTLTRAVHCGCVYPSDAVSIGDAKTIQCQVLLSVGDRNSGLTEFSPRDVVELPHFDRHATVQLPGSRLVVELVAHLPRPVVARVALMKKHIELDCMICSPTSSHTFPRAGAVGVSVAVVVFRSGICDPLYLILAVEPIPMEVPAL